jgi:hypothetical protein
VSHAVSGLTSSASTSIEAMPSTMAKTSTWRARKAPVASGRRAVRAISLSMRSSIRWLNAAAEAEASQMPSVPNTSARHGGRPGTARNMPITAQNTSSATTRGLVNCRYSRRCAFIATAPATHAAACVPARRAA